MSNARKKLAVFAVAFAIFAAADFWVFSTVRGAFIGIADRMQASQTDLFVKTAPKDAAEIPAWLSSSSDAIPGVKFTFIGIDADSGSYVCNDPDSKFVDFWNAHKDDAEFAKGLDSAYYFEAYTTKGTYEFDGMKSSVSFKPLLNDDGSEITGILMTMRKSGGYADFDRLLWIFGISILTLFSVIWLVVAFSRDRISTFAVIALAVFAFIFIAYPLFETLRLTVMPDGKLSLSIWRRVLGGDYLRAFGGSMTLGALTATVSTVVGFLFAFVITRTAIRAKGFISAMATLPVISPPFSLTLSVILLAGNNGLITKQILGLQTFSIYGLAGLVIVQTISMFPIAFMTISGVLKSIDSTQEDAALDLQANRWQTFSTITFPLALPGILSAWLLVFTNSLADFANPLLLAGNFRVLSVEAYMEVTGRNDLGGGAALSVLLLLPTLTTFLVQRYWVSKKSFVTVTGKPSNRITDLTSTPVRVALAGLVVMILAFIIGLYGTIVAGCFVKNWGIDYTFTLANIGEALSRGKKAIADTVTLSAIAAPLAGIISMIGALIVVRKSFIGKRVLEAMLMTPFAIPGTLLGIAYILAFNKAPLILVGTAAIIVINYVVRELPVGLEGGVANLRQVDPSIEEAAQDLGADSATVFRTIVLPILRPSFISSMSYTFVRSMTAVSAIIFLISARWYHLTVQIYNFSENLRFGLASVLSTALIIIVFLAFGIMNFAVRDKGNMKKNIVA